MRKVNFLILINLPDASERDFQDEQAVSQFGTLIHHSSRGKSTCKVGA